MALVRAGRVGVTLRNARSVPRATTPGENRVRAAHQLVPGGDALRQPSPARVDPGSTSRKSSVNASPWMPIARYRERAWLEFPPTVLRRPSHDPASVEPAHLLMYDFI